MKREDYPRCPVCGGPVAGAMMTKGSVYADGRSFDPATWSQGDRLFFPPESLAVYCVSATCNWDRQLSDLKTPVPPAEDPGAVTRSTEPRRFGMAPPEGIHP